MQEEVHHSTVSSCPWHVSCLISLSVVLVLIPTWITTDVFSTSHKSWDLRTAALWSLGSQCAKNWRSQCCDRSVGGSEFSLSFQPIDNIDMPRMGRCRLSDLQLARGRNSYKKASIVVCFFHPVSSFTLKSVHWIVFRLLKSFRMPFLANNFICVFFKMILLWFADMVFLWLRTWLMVFLWFWILFFMVGKMTYVFLMVLNMFFLWFWIRFLILIDFGRVSLSQKPFPTTEPDFEAKLKKIG